MKKTDTPYAPPVEYDERGVFISAYPTLPPACLPTPHRMDATPLALSALP